MLKGDFLCRTCSKRLKGRQAIEHRKQGHDVWHLNRETGELSHRYGERPPGQLTPVPAISGQGDRHIKEQYKGYREDGADYVFIIFSDGKIRDMRLEYPLLFPIYELARKDLNYKGTFPQFLADSVETLFAAAGYELVLAPKRQMEVYDEVARLKREEKLIVTYDEKGIRLEVNYERREGDEDKAEHPEAGIGAREHNHQSPEEGGREQESIEPE